MSQKIKKYLIFLFILTFFSLFAYQLGYKIALSKTLFSNNKNFSQSDFFIFLKTWDLINKNFVDPSKIDKNKAILEASRGLIKSLEDPYSDILSKNQRKIFEEDLSGSFGGVGFEIGIRNGILTVIAPLEGTPAERAGLKPGDKILKIDNQSTENMSLEDAVLKIRGKPGTKVILTIYRESWIESKDFEITREIINVPAVKGKLIEEKIGYIKINTFNAKTYSEFLKSYYDFKNRGSDRFIIDLRNNPGGYLEVAIKMSELFLPRGKIVLKEERRNKNIKDIISAGPGNLSSEKILILINRGSASASEIFASALRDNLGFKIVGEKSYGKGSVQQAFPLDGNLLKITIAYWLTPKGLRIEGNGIIPDVEVKEKEILNEDQFKKEDQQDEILNKAIELIKTI